MPGTTKKNKQKCNTQGKQTEEYTQIPFMDKGNRWWVHKHVYAIKLWFLGVCKYLFLLLEL